MATLHGDHVSLRGDCVSLCGDRVSLRGDHMQLRVLLQTACRKSVTVSGRFVLGAGGRTEFFSTHRLPARAAHVACPGNLAALKLPLLVFLYSARGPNGLMVRASRLVVVRLSSLSGRALAAQARGVLDSTPGGCRPFSLSSIFAS